MEGYTEMTEYKYDTHNITAKDMEPFFEGWSRKPSPEKRLKLLQNSAYVIFAINDNRVVGFINAISDNTLSAYIPLLEVLPEYRKKGIGKELVKRMMDQLKDYYMVDLCCDEKLEGFYKSLGMNKVCGMIKRNYDKI